MDTCLQCGASVSRRDPSCPFCRARNAAHEPVPVEAMALLARGIEAMAHARYADAVEAFGRAVAADPEAFDAYFQLSAACDRLGMHERALEATRRAIALRPTSAAMHFNAGTFLLRLGRQGEARASFERAHELATSDPETPNREGVLGYVRAELAKLSGG